MDAFVVPKRELMGNGMDVVTVARKEYRVGITPLDVNLAPGEYAVTVKCKPTDFREDGEAFAIQELKSDGSGFELVGKAYYVTVVTGHKYLVSALFWPKSQSLEAFARTLPKDQLVPRIQMEALQRDFKSHAVPEQDWANLLLMFRTMGKAAWHGKDKSECLFVQCTELEPKTVVATYPVDDKAGH